MRCMKRAMVILLTCLLILPACDAGDLPAVAAAEEAVVGGKVDSTSKAVVGLGVNLGSAERSSHPRCDTQRREECSDQRVRSASERHL